MLADLAFFVGGLFTGGAIMYFIQPQTKVITEDVIATEQRVYDAAKPNPKVKTPPTPSK